MEMISYLIKYVLYASDALAGIMFVVAGVEYAIGKVNEAKARMSNAVFGLILLATGHIIFNFLNPVIMEQGVYIPKIGEGICCQYSENAKLLAKADCAKSGGVEYEGMNVSSDGKRCQPVYLIDAGCCEKVKSGATVPAGTCAPQIKQEYCEAGYFKPQENFCSTSGKCEYKDSCLTAPKEDACKRPDGSWGMCSPAGNTCIPCAKKDAKCSLDKECRGSNGFCGTQGNGDCDSPYSTLTDSSDDKCL